SANAANSFMNEMRTASIVLAAYLVNSAERTPITISFSWLRENGAYSVRITSVAHASRLPMAMRSAATRSPIAVPSFRSREAETTENSCAAPRRASSPAMASRTRSAVPTGTVLLSTTTQRSANSDPIARATASTCDRSAEPSSVGGVPTAMKTTSAPVIASAASSVKRIRCCASPRSSKGTRPGSWIGTSPRFSRATRSASTSTQATWLPISAKQAAVTSPTYPAPKTASRIVWAFLPSVDPVVFAEPLHERAQPLIEWHARHETGHPRELVGLRERALDVARLHAHLVAHRLAPGDRLEPLDQLVDADRVAAAEVHHLERRPAGVRAIGVPVGRIRGAARRARHAEQAHGGLDGVVDVGEVARQHAAAVDVDRLAAQQRVGKLPDRHVGPPPGPVDREVAQPGDRQREQVRVAVRHKLVGALGRRVQAYRVVDRVALRERNLPVGAVDARAAREHQ